MNFKVFKTDNEIETLCIANALANTLDFNEINYMMYNKRANITIETEDFDIEDLIFNPMIIEETYNINSSMSMKNNEGQIKELNNFMENNLENIFYYYLTHDNKYLSKEMTRNVKATGIGNYFHTLSIRQINPIRPDALKIPIYIRHLAYLGWAKSVGYINNGDIEITTLLSPKQTNTIYKPFRFTYKDKETGEIKNLTRMKGDSDVLILAKQYLNTLLEYQFLNKSYEKIIVMSLTMAGNKPLSDKQYDLKIYNWSNNLLERFLNNLNYSTVNYDIKDITSKYILNPNYNNFRKLIQTYSKNDSMINKKHEEELLNMYSDKVKRIYNNEVVKKLGQGLNRLLYNKKGFEIQTKLYNVANEIHIQKCIREIIDEYYRNFKYQLLDHEELIEVINLINDKKEAKICSDALLANAKVFIKFKDEKENKGNLKEEK